MKTNMQFGIKSKLGLVVAVGSMLLAGNAFGQTAAPMSTTITGTTWSGGEALSIKQSGTDISSNAGGVRFAFDKLDDIDPLAFDNSEWSLVEVNVTMTMNAYDQWLRLTNNGDTDYVGVNGDAGSITFTLPTYSLGAITSNAPASFDTDGSFGSIRKSTFTDNSPILNIDLNGTTVTPDSFVEVAPANPTVNQTVTKTVNSDWWGDYTGSGSFDFDLRNLLSVSFSGTGSDLLATQSLGNTTFFSQVEYVVIPEVGTLAMMGIAFGSLAGITLYRRRKRV